MLPKFLAGVLVLAGVQIQSGDIPITGVELRTERRPVAVDVVAIHNRHSVPLVRWVINAGNYSNTGTGTILPNEVRRLTYEKQPAASPMSAVIELAVFANGEVQGTRAALVELERESRGLVDELVFWQTALDTLPRSPQSTAFAYVRNKLEERRRVVRDEPTGIRARIESFFSPTVPRPISWTFSGVNNLKADVAEALAQAKSVHASVSGALNSPDARTRSYRVTAVDVSIETGTANAMVLILKNLRSIPLEAWGYQEFAPRSIWPKGGHSSDVSGAPSRPGTGRLAPGEARDIRMLLEPALEQQASTFAPWFAVWEDLVWQGSASERASVMERRRQQALVHAFWIGQLKAVAELSPQAAITALRAAIEERRRTDSGERGNLMNGNIEMFARTAAETPELLHGRLEAFRRALEEQYAWLTRSR